MLMHSRGYSPVIIKTSPFKMPLDFTAYLMSSSPPGVDFGSFNDRLCSRYSGRNSPYKALTTPVARVKQSHSFLTKSSSLENLYSVKEFGDEGLISESRCTSSTNDLTDDAKIAALSKSMSDSCTIGFNGKLKKSVSFADEKGLRLTRVRVMAEHSSQPPLIRPELLSRLSGLTHGAKAKATAESPPLVLAFPQPASDYVRFRENVEKNSVSLENVMLNNYTVIGTVKVKNVAFEKQVKIRVTFDGWETNQDIAAEYVPHGLSSPYDTFSFKLSVPPDFDVSKKIEFCVCYEACNQQFWDSNEGQNYVIRSSKWQEDNIQDKSQSIFNLGYSSTDWSTYSSWHYLDNEVPYY